MAIINPSWKVIERLHQKPTEGELTLLRFLESSLDDTYEIFFQPMINGDNPDIVLMRKGSGVVIIEVKDWNLDHYVIGDDTKWRLRKDNTVLRSPFNQLEHYKENLFKLHVEELYKRNVKNKKYWATVNCAVYLHNASALSIDSFVHGKFMGEGYESYRKFLSYFEILGSDSLSANNLNRIISKFWLDKSSYYFDDTLYNSFLRFLNAPVHQLEEGIEIVYTKEQLELTRSEIRPRRKIKGAAGSGKTLVLAKRAVNAFKRTNGTILILTYNLSLKNYIHDRVSDVREKFPWGNFYITNYHQFFKTQANNYNLEITGLSCWQDTAFFSSVSNNIIKYDAILIDEIQDYQQEWIDIVTKYFSHADTEFVVFGDEKQNIYDRVLDENNEPVVRTIPGNWNKSLNTSHRFSSQIGNIAMKFQKELFGTKYTPDDLNFLSQFDYDRRVIEYHYFHLHSTGFIIEKIFSILIRHAIHSSDTCILSARVEILRELDHTIRTIKHEETETTFESLEDYTNLKNNKDKIEDIRRMKKNHFWMKTGTMKLSTIHSFKGWEIDTLFLIIENEPDQDFTNREMIYTALTRARTNLIIFNLGNERYDRFFRKEIEKVEDVRDKIIF